MSKISPQKEYLLSLLDTLGPLEEITITADREGKPNRFLVRRSQKIMVTEIEIRPVA
jgi:hypothetical protein